MVLSYPKPLGLSSASRTIATLPYVSGAEFLNQMDKQKLTRGLPNVVQMQSRIVGLCILSPLRAGLYNVPQCQGSLLPFRFKLLRPLPHRYTRQRKGDDLLPRFDKHLVLVKQRALIEHHRTRLCIARLLAGEAILMFVEP